MGIRNDLWGMALIASIFVHDSPLTCTLSLRLPLRLDGRGSAFSGHAAYAPGSALAPLLARRTAGQAEAQVTEPEHRIEPVAVRRTAVHGVEDPAPASVHPERAR